MVVIQLCEGRGSFLKIIPRCTMLKKRGSLVAWHTHCFVSKCPVSNASVGQKKGHFAPIFDEDHFHDPPLGLGATYSPPPLGVSIFSFLHLILPESLQSTPRFVCR
uniref:Uncharacterized protein n=1 Tax=Odontella aurita TaxID=265563 RepID=A0A7S4MWP6_9STRA